jgi:hypothetical protein
MVWVLVQRKILCLWRSPNSGPSSLQLRHSQLSVLSLCYRNILHDSHFRSGNWLRSGRSAASDIHRLSDCRSDRVSCNPIVRNILIAQLFNNVVSNIDVLQSLMRGKYSCIARRQEFGNKTAVVLYDKPKRVLLDTLRKTTKYRKLRYHPGTSVIQEGLPTSWVSCSGLI